MGKGKLFWLLAAVIIGAVAVPLVVNQAQARTAAPQDLETYIVAAGDTLWSIASQHRGRIEIRRYIYELKKLNDLGQHIYPGQELLLPPGQ